MSLPYFSLEKYAYQKVGDKSTSHPVRTLLQSHIPSVGRERDINQVASKLPNVPEEFCFHVPQLWCLVIDGGEPIVRPVAGRDADEPRPAYNRRPAPFRETSR
jgi:hypothetical protein